MNWRVLLAGLLSVVCLATVAALVIQRGNLTDLRAEKSRLLAQMETASDTQTASAATTSATTVPGVPGPPGEVSAELLHLRSEVTRLTTRQHELAGVRAENERLRLQVANRATNSAGPALPPGYIRPSQARQVGYNTPEDALQSMLWAMHNHDLTNLIQALDPESAQRVQDRVQQMGSAADFFRGADSLPGMVITSQKPMEDGSIEAKIEIIPGQSAETLRFRPIGGQWKIVGPF